MDTKGVIISIVALTTNIFLHPNPHVPKKINLKRLIGALTVHKGSCSIRIAATQYSSAAFRKILDELNVLHSFSAKACPFDNAIVEAFFKFLNAEETNRKAYSNLADLLLSLFEYIDGFYNPKRPHSAVHLSKLSAFITVVRL